MLASSPPPTAGICSNTSRPSTPLLRSLIWCLPIPPAGNTRSSRATGGEHHRHDVRTAVCIADSNCIDRPAPVRHFVLDLEVMQTGIDYGHRDACFSFGVQDPSHFYYAHVATTQDAVAHQIHIVNGAPRTAITLTSTTGCDWGRNVWRHMQVVRDIDSGLIE